MNILSAILGLVFSLITFLYAGTVLQYGWNELLPFVHLGYPAALAVIVGFGILTAPANITNLVNVNSLLDDKGQATRNWVMRISYAVALGVAHLLFFFLTSL